MELRFQWKFTLGVEPERLWQYIADTGSLNEAAGLPEWKLQYIPEDDGGSRQVGETRYMGWRLKWDEHPFEWIEGRRFEVLRVYHNGPVRWFRLAVRLSPVDGGSLLEQDITVEPRWLLMAPGIYWDLGYRSRNRFKRVYQKIDAYLRGQAETPFRPSHSNPIPRDRVERLERRLQTVDGSEYLPHLLNALETHSDTELHRMRAFAFADEWGADRVRVLKLFLHAVTAGLLDVSWDVICPSCRGAKVRTSKLRDLRKEAHCDACNIRYSADFAESVELTFLPSPGIRKVEVTDYCSGGPMRAPHVVVQQQIPSGDTRAITLALKPWQYRLRSLKLPTHMELKVGSEFDVAGVTAILEPAGIAPEETFQGEEFTLTIQNNTENTHTVMLERTSESEQATTAAFVTTMSEFRSLFASEVLAPDTQVRTGTLCLMFTDLRGSTSMYEAVGDTSAYARVRQHFEILREVVGAHGGTFVKTIGDAVMAAFTDPSGALGAAFEMHDRMRPENEQHSPPLTLKIGLHQGPCFAVNMNENLDYFGTTVNIAARVQKASLGGDIMVTDEIYNDHATTELLSGRAHVHEQLEIEIRGLAGTRHAHRITPRF